MAAGPQHAAPPGCGSDEDEALEVLAYLVTSARTQVDEAAEYGPLRLVTAARRLAEFLRPRASGDFAAVIDALAEIPLLAVPRDDRQDYVEQLDGACRAVARHLSDRFAPDR